LQVNSVETQRTETASTRRADTTREEAGEIRRTRLMEFRNQRVNHGRMPWSQIEEEAREFNFGAQPRLRTLTCCTGKLQYL
jgi:hypothetical protein